MPVCHACGTMEATANMRRRRPPHTGEWACKDKPSCQRRVKALPPSIVVAKPEAARPNVGRIEVGKTRVRVPGYGNGLAVTITKAHRDFRTGFRSPPQVIVLLDDGTRVARGWADLEPPLPEGNMFDRELADTREAVKWR
jgi:hypothetical protein